MEGRGKVAYDPRDFDNGNEEKEVPRLTLMEEVLLLGLKDKAVSAGDVCEAWRGSL
jgi:Golgi phosphoprotein 3